MQDKKYIPLWAQKKIARLIAGGKPRVLDLFSGCGGISLGFHRAGFEIAGAIELDKHAAKTHALNFHKDSDHFEKHAKPRDILETEPEDLALEIGLGEVETSVDIIVGGPPCQSFARVGRAKLREIAAHPEAYLHDPRGNLYLRYIHYVNKFKPLALLMENVPDVLNYGGHNIAEETCETLEEMGYVCGYTILNAVHYGVPEMRQRMFLVAFAEELGVDVDFPKPTNGYIVPAGYKGSRQVALKTLSESVGHRYMPVGDGDCTLPPAVTSMEAIGDLPKITLHLEGKLKRGARRFTQLMPYDNSRLCSPYAKNMRMWPGFENDKGIYDHLIRYLPRDYAIFNRMNHGDQYPEAYKHALEMLEEKLNTLSPRPLVGSQKYEEILKTIVPPYDPGKFPNKWRKMEPDKPARTLMAHLGKDSYSHIHYDCEQARTISIREAARLQSFPDGFTFSGTMNPAFRQIGNAVPPLLSYAIAQNIFRALPSAKKLEHKGGKCEYRRTASPVY